MFSAVYYVATATILAASALCLVDRRPRWLYAVITMFPLANIYVAGVALTVVLVALLIDSTIENVPLRSMAWIPAAWGFWFAWTIPGILHNGLDARALFQMAEFLMYGLIGSLLAAVFLTSSRLMHRVLHYCLLSAALLATACIIASLASSEWPATLPGRNESAFILIAIGALPATFCTVGASQLGFSRLSFATTLVLFTMILAAVVLMESRGATLITAACITSAVLFQLCRRNVPAFLVTSTATLGVTIVVMSATGFLSELANTQINFSNIERLGMLAASYRLFIENPLLGHGWGSGDAIFPSVPETVLSYPHPHNTFARFATEMGVGGIVFLSAIFGRFLVRARAMVHRGMFAETYWLLIIFASLLALSMIDVLLYGASRAIPFMVIVAFAEGLPLRTHILIPATGERTGGLGRYHAATGRHFE